MPSADSLDPAGSPVDVSAAPVLKRRGILTMIVLMVVTLGLYYPVWFLRRRAAFNRLNSPRKLQLWPFLLCLALYIVDFAVTIASGDAPVAQLVGAGAALLLSLARLAVGILMVVQCFFIKDMLEDHLAGPADAVPNWMSNPVSLSALLTFFFQIFYLQYIINRDIVGARPQPVWPHTDTTGIARA